ncbi:MAG TPA: hypothetical protein VM715_04925 [Candidatus Acidoferrum sp.]|nr:hypothetical protein [Candidatus Acidoferrum sp.]
MVGLLRVDAEHAEYVHQVDVDVSGLHDHLATYSGTTSVEGSSFDLLDDVGQFTNFAS